MDAGWFVLANKIVYNRAIKYEHAYRNTTYRYTFENCRCSQNKKQEGQEHLYILHVFKIVATFQWSFKYHTVLFASSKRLNSSQPCPHHCSWQFIPQRVPPFIRIPSKSNMRIFVNEVLHTTWHEVSERNIFKPPQIRHSKKMGLLKMSLSLKESINLVLDRKG